MPAEITRFFAREDYWRGAALAVLCFLLFELGNSRTSLWDRDEPRYAETARVMRRSGDWIVPYFNGTFRFQKPVLLYWLVAGFYGLLGESAFAARLVSGLAVTAACLVTRTAGNRWLGRPAGDVAGVLLALCPVTFLLGKLCIPDGVQLLCGTICYACLWWTWRPANPARAARSAFVFWLALSASLLVKGPIVLAMLLASLMVFRLLTGTPLSDFRLRWRLGLFILLAVALPWFGAIWYTVGPSFFHESVGQQLVNRVAVSFDGKFLPPGYYLATLVMGFAPWLALLVLSLFRLRSEWRLPGTVAYLLAWMIGPLLLVELFRSKQVHYLAPAYPAMALAIGGYVSRLRHGQMSWQVDWWTHACLTGQAVAGGVVVAFFLVLAVGGPEPARLAAFAAALAMGLGLGIAQNHWRGGRWQFALLTQGAAMTFVMLLVGGVLLPAAEPVRAMRPLADLLAAEHQQTGEPLLLHRVLEPSMVFYAGLSLPEVSDPDRFRAAALAADKPVLTVVTDGELSQWQEQWPGKVEVRHTLRGWIRMHPDLIHIVRLHPPQEPANVAGRAMPTTR